MKIRVDPAMCQGHNRCMTIASELFEVDDLGYATALNDGAVPPELEEKAKKAIDNCPEIAIILAED